MKKEKNKIIFEKFKTLKKQKMEVVVDTCRICLCEFEDEESKLTLDCEHKFHISCIDEYINVCFAEKKEPECPLCRKKVLSDSKEILDSITIDNTYKNENIFENYQLNNIRENQIRTHNTNTNTFNENALLTNIRLENDYSINSSRINYIQRSINSQFSISVLGINNQLFGNTFANTCENFVSNQSFGRGEQLNYTHRSQYIDQSDSLRERRKRYTQEEIYNHEMSIKNRNRNRNNNNQNTNNNNNINNSDENIENTNLEGSKTMEEFYKNYYPRILCNTKLIIESLKYKIEKLSGNNSSDNTIKEKYKILSLKNSNAMTFQFNTRSFDFDSEHDKSFRFMNILEDVTQHINIVYEIDSYLYKRHRISRDRLDKFNSNDYLKDFLSFINLDRYNISFLNDSK